MTENRTPYPVRVDAALDPSTSRWLWLSEPARPTPPTPSGAPTAPPPASVTPVG